MALVLVSVLADSSAGSWVESTVDCLVDLTVSTMVDKMENLTAEEMVMSMVEK